MTQKPLNDLKIEENVGIMLLVIQNFFFCFRLRLLYIGFQLVLFQLFVYTLHFKKCAMYSV